MLFNLGKDNACIDCKLTPLAGGETVEIKTIQFRRASVGKIADIMKRGVTQDNQDLVVDSIVCSKAEYAKLSGKRYKLTGVGLADIGNNFVTAIEVILGNIEIDFDIQRVKSDGDYLEINFAKITAYQNPNYSFRELDDNE